MPPSHLLKTNNTLIGRSIDLFAAIPDREAPYAGLEEDRIGLPHAHRITQTQAGAKVVAPERIRDGCRFWLVKVRVTVVEVLEEIKNAPVSLAEKEPVRASTSASPSAGGDRSTSAADRPRPSRVPARPKGQIRPDGGVPRVGKHRGLFE